MSVHFDATFLYWVIIILLVNSVIIQLFFKKVFSLRRKLQVCEEEFRTLVDSIDDTVVTVDNNQCITGIYGQRFRKSKISSEILIGKKIQEMPFNTQSALDHAEKFERAVKGENVSYEWQNEKNDGVNYYQTILSPMYVAEEKIIGIVGVVRNITELKKTQEALATEKERLGITLRSIGDGVISTDITGKIILINEAAEQIIGYLRDEVEGKQMGEVLHFSDLPGSHVYDDPLTLLLNGKGQNARTDFTLISKQGVYKTITGNSSPLKDKQNRNVGFVLIIRDITEQRKIEAHQAISQKLESIGQLAAGIAHEINTPMQYINDNAKFLCDAFQQLMNLIQFQKTLLFKTENSPAHPAELNELGVKEQQMELEYLLTDIPKAFDQTLQGIERVNKIILAIKDFAHPGGKEKAFADINQAVERTITISRNEWKYVADLELHLEPELPLVFCAIDEINQVILNMIINAAHAIGAVISQRSSPKGVIRIDTKKNNDLIEITIGDTGEGIPPALISRIFDPFFTTKEVGKGTGQGLAIAHDIIVNRHQGRILVESNEGKGTTFTVQLPVDVSVENGTV